MAWRDFSVGVGLVKNPHGRAVLDAARKVQIFGLGVKNAMLALQAEMDGDEGSGTDKTRKRLKFCGGYMSKCRHGWSVVGRRAEFCKDLIRQAPLAARR